MTELFTIPLVEGHRAIAARIQDPLDLPSTLERFGLQRPRPTLALVGGASNMTSQDYELLRGLFTTVIAETVADTNAAIVDGGTNAGIMRLIGQARTELNANFPLIGVAPFRKMQLPHLCHLPPASATPAPNHTHFILVPGEEWGDESVWLAKVTTLLSGSCPSATLVINGGNVTWQDVVESVAAQRLTLVLAGSGRTADQLAAALHNQSQDKRANQIVATGLVKLVHLEVGLPKLAQQLQQLLMPTT